ncbi:hypothetical protein HPB48_022407 [Haemaphysalis longicornis]|uniref:Uncharacterized protein n=1 Tax=Haemaphysalis longicornis TaxID=44386 RepID=A0A9J6GWZ7_HAELO|nr:hypothetical protein HPB48_022407 [Haemaphysalis longicornis]
MRASVLYNLAFFYIFLVLAQFHGLKLTDGNLSIFIQHKCKHMVAILLHFNSQMKLSVLSSADLPQEWDKAQKLGVKEKNQPRRIVDLSSSKR